MTICREDVDRLLELAGGISLNEAEYERFCGYLEGARFFWLHLPRPLGLSEHHRTLRRIKTASDELIWALHDLSSEGEPYSDFWLSPVFEDSYWIDATKRQAIVDNVVRVAFAAEIAMDTAKRRKGKGRPFHHHTQDVVNVARDLLSILFQEHGVKFAFNGSRNGGFATFARAVFEIVTGIDPNDEGKGIDKQIERAAADVPPWLAESRD